MAKATSDNNGAAGEAVLPAAPAVSSNPVLVEFPTDEFGFTNEFRRAGLRAAARVKGDPKKQELFMAVLRTLALHSQARAEGEDGSLAKRAEQLQAEAMARGEHLRCARPA